MHENPNRNAVQPFSLSGKYAKVHVDPAQVLSLSLCLPPLCLPSTNKVHVDPAQAIFCNTVEPRYLLKWVGHDQVH